MDKEEFMNNYIFNEFKDSVLYGADRFKKMIYGKYGILIDSNLYRRLINYQTKNYGYTLVENGREHIRNFSNKSIKSRNYFKLSADEREKLKRFEDRNNGKDKIKKI